MGGRAAVEEEVWMLERVMAVTEEREEIVDMFLVGFVWPEGGWIWYVFVQLV